MAKAPKALVAGNWKMNGKKAAAKELRALAKAIAKSAPKADAMICPPATLIDRFAQEAKGTKIAIGAQDCHANEAGAHTGDIAANMVKDLGGKAIIVGHSERRADHGETNKDVNAKAQAVIAEGLTAIVCVGETEQERDKGQTLRVVGAQLKGSIPDDITAKNLVVAYEPVWAIGTGRTPTAEDVAKVHAHIRKNLIKRFGEKVGSQIRLLYGGSVKAANAVELMGVPNVNGALVGGASLTAKDFNGILDAYR